MAIRPLTLVQRTAAQVFALVGNGDGATGTAFAQVGLALVPVVSPIVNTSCASPAPPGAFASRRTEAPSVASMPLPRFVPVMDLPEDGLGSVTVAVLRGEVIVLDDHPDDVAPGAPRLLLGTLDGTACWAVDLDGDGVPDLVIEGLRDALVPLMGLHGQVDDARWTLAGRAVQLVEWERTHRFCGRCATATEPAPGERARRCPSCGLLAYPRLAPAVITLIERDGEALLARGRAFPVPMYSCIAGFVEPGETLEEAVRREVREEVGVELAEVRYTASQPWPFPHSLMIGFEATWASGDIEVDEHEIVDAQWYRPDDLPMIPPPLSIARTLIDRWIERST